MSTNKIISLYIILVLIIGIIISGTTLAESANQDDDLDQMQNDYTFDNAEVNEYQQWAQSFTPTVSLLSRVELYLENLGSHDTFIVSIRSDLDGYDLTSSTIASSLIPHGNKTWIEFDFPDIEIEAGAPYYIVCTHDSEEIIQWAASYNNEYKFGKAFYRDLNPNEIWKPWEDDMPFPYSVDLCFRTYGRFHKPNQPSEPKGPNQIRINRIGQYWTSTIDMDEDLIRYGWDWNDDDIVDEWTGYYQSGEIRTINHTWSSQGDYLIKVIAEDIDGYLSDWSYSKSLVVPKTRENSISIIFELLFQKLISSFDLFNNYF